MAVVLKLKIDNPSSGIVPRADINTTPLTPLPVEARGMKPPYINRHRRRTRWHRRNWSKRLLVLWLGRPTNSAEMWTSLLAVCLLGLVGPALVLATPLTPGETGPAVVEATTEMINLKCIFDDDQFFMRRLASVESNDGLTNNGTGGGIWRVSEG